MTSNRDNIYFTRRDGTLEDPYVDITENLYVQYGKIFLKEIPHEPFKVVIQNDDNSAMTEVFRDDDLNTTNTFYVDYREGIVYFNSYNDGLLKKVTYKGTGVILYPASRIYTDAIDGRNVIETLKDALGSVEEITPVGDYDGSTTYKRGNIVIYNEQTYMATADSTGVLPTDASYWRIVFANTFIPDASVTSQKMHGSVGMNQYPFDKKSIVSTDETEASLILDAIKDITIDNADETANYWLGSLRREHSSGGILYWQIGIQKDGVTILNWQVSGAYSVPSGLESIELLGTSGEVVETATVLIDWNALPVGFVAGEIRPHAVLDFKTYTDLSTEFTLPDSIVTSTKIHNSVGMNQYPFDKRSIISTDETEAALILDAIKDINIQNADETASYWLGSLRREHDSGGVLYWQVGIQKDGVTILNWQVSDTHAISSGVEKVELTATSSSVEEIATVWIDWNALPIGFVAGEIRPHATLDLQTYAELSSEGAVSGIHKLKVMSHNQGVFAMGGYPSGVAAEDVDTTIRAWRDFLAKHNCDILGLQEARREIDTDRTISTYPELYANSYKNFYDTGQGYNLAIASKYSISGEDNITLSGDNRRALKVYIQMGKKKICFVSTHLSSATTELDAERATQRQEILDIVANEKYFIICGDFNIRLDSEYDDFKNAGYNLANNSWHGDLPTAHHPSPTTMKDNVITSANIAIDKVILDNSSEPSDHLALICDLTIY
jgi:endonuclease/exonuclease/phosphatase family metal-dependent hydrolase